MNGQLIDIHGLDLISWWPPASGWWLLSGGLILIALLLTLLFRHLIRYPPGSWRREAAAALRELRQRQHEWGPKERASRLSELLRRIAMARFGRARLASLTGEEWLQWLQDNDPEGFAWVRHGHFLLQLPYAPEDWNVDPKELDLLVRAALRMVAASKEDAAHPKRKWRRRAHV